MSAEKYTQKPKGVSGTEKIIDICIEIDPTNRTGNVTRLSAVSCYATHNIRGENGVGFNATKAANGV